MRSMCIMALNQVLVSSRGNRSFFTATLGEAQALCCAKMDLQCCRRVLPQVFQVIFVAAATSTAVITRLCASLRSFSAGFRPSCWPGTQVEHSAFQMLVYVRKLSGPLPASLALLSLSFSDARSFWGAWVSI